MLTLLVSAVFALQALEATAIPSPTNIKRATEPVIPEVIRAQLIANVTDPRVSRDSCTSTKIQSRTLWTCRDTMAYDLEKDKEVPPLVVNTGAWTDMNKDKTPHIVRNGQKGSGSNGSNPILQMYGKPDLRSKIPFYPVKQEDACTLTSGGKCEDGTRTVVWQDSAPMVQSSKAKGKTVAYTWIANWHIDKLKAIVKEPSYSLYKMVYDNRSKDRELLPTNTLIDANFWEPGEIGYGAYGRVVRGGWAYLYGQGLYRHTALAKVPLSKVTDKKMYQYWVNGQWTKNRPTMANPDAWIPNAGAGKQGRFYYSDHFSSYMWIGQRNQSLDADFYLTTAPAPEGPWIRPFLIFSGQNGDSDLPSYSLQAHPSLLQSSKEKGIYLTWTQGWAPETYGSYVTPLVYVSFK